jgi:diacylglycerol kinase family enzyme
LWHYRPALVVRADGIEHRAAGLIAAKIGSTPPGLRRRAAGRLTEPALELVLFRRAGRLAVLRRRLCRSAPAPASVTTLRTRAVTVTGGALPVQADGEIVGQIPVTIEIADQPLCLIQPGG